jgi:UDP-sugar transporter A1/2/3
MADTKVERAEEEPLLAGDKGEPKQDSALVATKDEKVAAGAEAKEEKNLGLCASLVDGSGRDYVPGFGILCFIVIFAFLTRGAHPLIAGMSKGSDKGGKHDIAYSLAWLLCLNSIIKLVICAIALPIQHGLTSEGPGKRALVQFDTKTFFAYSLPAVFYQISDVAYVMMLVVMNPALGPPMASLKILFTGVFVHSLAVTSLGRGIFPTLNDVQWIALGLLLIGVVLTTPMGKVSSSKTGGAGAESDKESNLGNIGLGLICAVVYSSASALANVGTELLFKKALTSEVEEVDEESGEIVKKKKAAAVQGLLLQNIQLYAWATVVCIAYMFAKEGAAIISKGPFHDFSGWVWALLILDSFGGLGASLVFKYLNNITFLFINVACMLASTLLSVPLFKFDFTPQFGVAIVVIFISMYLYKRGAIKETAVRLWNHYMTSFGLGSKCGKCAPPVDD